MRLVTRPKPESEALKAQLDDKPAEILAANTPTMSCKGYFPRGVARRVFVGGKTCRPLAFRATSKDRGPLDLAIL